MKNKKTIILIIGIIILLSLVLIYFISGKYSSQDSLKFKREYESINNTKREKDGQTIRSITIPKDNPMMYSNEDEVVDMINNKETFLVYFGFSDCPWCRSVLPNLIKAAKNLKLEKIYYVNIKEIRDTIEYQNGKLKTTKEGSKGYYKLLKLLDNVLEEYTITNDQEEEITANEKRIYAPNVIAIVNGKAEQLEDGISEKQTDGYMSLTKKMNQESYNKFKCLIKCLQETKTTCPKEKSC